MKPYLMSEIRKIFPKELTKLEQWIENINFYIEMALNNNQRIVIYQFDTYFDITILEEIINIYRNEGYEVRREIRSVGYPRITICW